MSAIGPSDGAPRMRGGGDEPFRVAPLDGCGAGRQPLGQVNAMRAHPACEPRVGPGKEDEALPAGQGGKHPALLNGIRRPEGAPDDAGAAWKAAHHGGDIRRARGIREEQQGWQALASPGAGVKPAGRLPEDVQV